MKLLILKLARSIGVTWESQGILMGYCYLMHLKGSERKGDAAKSTSINGDTVYSLLI
jgi:hypothetical protein